MKVTVFTDMEEMSRAAADLFAETAKMAVAAYGRFAVALSGGHTPRRLHQLLALSMFQNWVPWDRIHIFWGDERCVPLDDDGNNAHNAMKELLNNVPISEAHIHRIESELPPREAARLYEKQLHEFFDSHLPRFDLVFLGLGENGHTASLFPGTPIVRETKRWVSEVFVEKQNMHRVSLTSWTINQARQIVFLVSGGNKARVLHEVLDGDSDPERLPARLIHPTRGELYWFVDKEAAALLESVSYQEK
jgi:6-phosphogluconolactonase